MRRGLNGRETIHVDMDADVFIWEWLHQAVQHLARPGERSVRYLCRDSFDLRVANSAHTQLVPTNFGLTADQIVLAAIEGIGYAIPLVAVNATSMDQRPPH